jgi:hypothetical protein
MNRVERYRQYAAECRLLAHRPHTPDHRRMLLEMARRWDALADEREAMMTRDYRLAGLDEKKG